MIAAAVGPPLDVDDPTPFAGLSDAELDALVVADLQAVQASRRATSQATRLEHETGAD